MDSPDSGRSVRTAMGTVISLQIDPGSRLVADRFFDRVEELEAILSRFRPDSDMSKLSRGETDFDSIDPSLRRVLTLCETVREATNGDFDHEAQGIDPGGLAKGWIVDEAATGLRADGIRSFIINAGGDVLARRPNQSNPWRVGVRHPYDATAVLATLELTSGAIATSGDYERPDHIRGRSGLQSVSVTGPDLGTADALATAVFACGSTYPKWWHRFEATHGLLTVGDDNQMIWRAPTVGSDLVLSLPRPNYHA